MIIGMMATGADQSTAAPLPAEGQIFFADVQVVPPGSGVRIQSYVQAPVYGTIRNSGSNALLIYPIPGGTINNSESPYSLAAAAVISMASFSAMDWIVLTGGGGGGSFTLTTFGSSGPSTYDGATLNIPVYVAGASPAFTAFAITGVSSPIEVGATIASGAHTFTWSTSDPSDIQANSISIADTTASTVLATGLANDGSEVITFGSGITNNSHATHVWTITGSIIGGGTFARTFSVTWDWRVWVGGSASPELDAAGVQSLAASALQNTIAGTYVIGTAGYKYIAVPTIFPAPSTFFDNSTGFNVPMCVTANDANFSGTDSNGNNYLPLSLTNGNGQTTAYALYRTQNSLGGSLTLRIA